MSYKLPEFIRVGKYGITKDRFECKHDKGLLMKQVPGHWFKHGVYCKKCGLDVQMQYRVRHRNGKRFDIIHNIKKLGYKTFDDAKRNIAIINAMFKKDPNSFFRTTTPNYGAFSMRIC